MTDPDYTENDQDATPDQYIVYGEYVLVDDGQGGTTEIEKPYDEPILVDELTPGLRGGVYRAE